MRIAMIDNYDSFTYNLVQYLAELGAQVEVVRNDAVSAAALLDGRPAGVVISPGPGEITTPAGRPSISAAALIASLRTTSTAAPSSERYCTRLYVKES